MDGCILKGVSFPLLILTLEMNQCAEGPGIIAFNLPLWDFLVRGFMFLLAIGVENI